MDTIKQIKLDIKIALSEDIDKAMDKFNAVISAESGLFDEFILLIARYRHIRNESLRNTVSVVDESIELAKIRGGFIKIINEIADVDLDNDKKKVVILDRHVSDEDAPLLVEEDEPGVLELNDLVLSDFQAMTALFYRIVEYQKNLTEATLKGTDKITTYNKSHPNANQFVLKHLVDDVAYQMILFAEESKPEIDLFEHLSLSAIKNSTKLIEAVYANRLVEDATDLVNLKESMLILDSESYKAASAISEYKLTIDKIPDLTTKLKKGKRMVANQCERFIYTINSHRVRIQMFVGNLVSTISNIEQT